VAATNEAAGRRATGRPRRPWLDPLPERIGLDELPPGAVALADDPDDQRRHPIGWDPTAGHLLLCGGLGSGRTTALAALALDAARRSTPDDLHLLVADFGEGGLDALRSLPHTGAVIRAGEQERAERLVRVLRDELESRRGSASGDPRLLVLVDGFATWRTQLEDGRRYDLLDDLDRVLREGPAVAIVAAMSVDGLAGVPSAIAATVAQRWLFRPADPSELLAAGVRGAQVPAWCPGRIHVVGVGLEAQVAAPGPLASAVAAVANRWTSPLRGPRSVDVLPELVALDTIERAVLPEHLVPLGIEDDTLGVGCLPVRRGDHVLVAGPARSGRTSALALLARQLRRRHPAAWVGGVVPRPGEGGGLAAFAEFDAVGRDLSVLGSQADRPGFLLVDDAELVDDPGGLLAARLASLDPDLQVVAAGRPEALRSYGHWTQHVRRSRLGVLLRPDPLVDGDLLGVTLPRGRRPLTSPGRGYLVADSSCVLAQLASARSAAVSVGPLATRSSAPPIDSTAASVYANSYPSTASWTRPSSSGPKATPSVDTNWLRL
jgi:S-DNA-T family DNA segregation ATPase FtsK/SpoIIIE